MRNGPVLRAAPIAGTARRAARQKETAPSRRVRAPGLDQPPAPAVERVGKPVARLGRRGECLPALAPDHAGEHDRANVGEFADPLALRERAAPRGTRPVARMAENTVSTSAPFTRIVLRGRATTVFGLHTHVSPIGLYTNHLAPNLRLAQNSNAPTRARAAQWRRLSLDAAYSEVSDGVFRASSLTRGPWNPDHQHAGPPSALICRAIERAAAKRRTDPSRAAHCQPLAARAHRRMSRRGRGGLRRPQRRPLFRSLDGPGQGMSRASPRSCSARRTRPSRKERQAIRRLRRRSRPTNARS